MTSLCRLLEISHRTIERWLTGTLTDRRKGAEKRVERKLSVKEREQVVQVCCSARYRNLTPYEIIPDLARKGQYIASESSFYRILRAEGLVRRRPIRTVAKRPQPIELKAAAINQLWSWDITYLRTMIRGKYFYLYLFMDIYSRAIMGWEVNDREDGALSAGLFKSLVKKWNATGVTLHSDNGGPMRSATMLATLQMLGVVPSFSRPSVSNDNPFSESLFKTLKYTAGYPRAFETIEEARSWVESFVDWYNNAHLHSGINYVTPMERHTGQDVAILEKRRLIYHNAYILHPERWTRKTRDWARPGDVFLKKANHQNAKKIVA